MKRVLVTGATGCVGSNLIRALLQMNLKVIAFHRTTSNTLNLKGLDVEHRYGDVRDKESLRQAIRGCDTVFHTAAIVSFWKNRRVEQLEVNVGGSRNVVEVCLQESVQKLVHTSSIAALGYRTDGELINESTSYNWGSAVGYKYSKHLSEMEILSGVARGLNAVIVNPTVIIGPGDIYIHGGQLVRDLARRKIPAYSAGGMNLVSVHDVVTGHIAAAEKGIVGERYILGGKNFTHKDAFKLIANAVEKPAPFIRAPVMLTKSIARMFDALGAITGKEPWITSELISGLGGYNWYSIDKAKKGLGYSPSSLEGVIRETYEWYKKIGKL
ncbi:MAG: SDR family oxidoreductase [Bacteroidota bacterium]